MKGKRILVIDDEEDLRIMLSSYLAAGGFEVTEATDGEQGLALLASRDFDLVVLDVGLPGLDGFEVLRELRVTSDVPVIMLTARTEEVDRVVGLTVGADDYVTKPFSPRELTARITAVLRRARSVHGRGDLLEFEGLRIDLGAREVFCEERPVELSALEFDLLSTLARAPRRVFTRDQLMEQVWGGDYFLMDRVVDVHISNLRKRLGEDSADPRFIATVRGVGYKFIGEAP
ncbi:MAG: response regulator transcription factor [Actinobacteria bacterium]|nr:response regulator transcription factor [Actinomycetota bacterium]